MLLQRGNQKLGPLIYNFSLPAFETCPGCTAACAAVCYARDGFYTIPSTKTSLWKNYEASMKRTFAHEVIAQIRKQKARLVRIHPAGDFYSNDYIKKWQYIAKRCGGTTFYVYTRAWRSKRLLQQLEKLARMHNVVMWWSADCETDLHNGEPPKVEGVRVAYMQMHDDDFVPEYTDLVFRVKRDTVRKFVQGRLVCPVENGYTGWVHKMTCSDCKICYRTKSVPTRDRDYTGPQEKVLANDSLDTGRPV